MQTKIILLLSAVFLLGACATENGEDLAGDTPTPGCNTANVTYALTIAPLLQKHCTQCHNSVLASSGVNLTTYANVRDLALNTQLIGTINHEPGYAVMPKNADKLPECDITNIRAWIAKGAPEK